MYEAGLEGVEPPKLSKYEGIPLPAGAVKDFLGKYEAGFGAAAALLPDRASAYDAIPAPLLLASVDASWEDERDVAWGGWASKIGS